MKDTLAKYLTGVDEERYRERQNGAHIFRWSFDITDEAGWRRCPMRALRRYARDEGIAFVRGKIPRFAPLGARGIFIKGDNVIVIDETLDEPNAFHVALHELAHYLTMPTIDRDARKEVRHGAGEITAEGVAYVVSQRYLAPTSRASLEYGALLAPHGVHNYNQALKHAVPEMIRASKILHEQLERYDGV